MASNASNASNAGAAANQDCEQEIQVVDQQGAPNRSSRPAVDPKAGESPDAQIDEEVLEGLKKGGFTMAQVLEMIEAAKDFESRKRPIAAVIPSSTHQALTKLGKTVKLGDWKRRMEIYLRLHKVPKEEWIDHALLNMEDDALNYAESIAKMQPTWDDFITELQRGPWISSDTDFSVRSKFATKSLGSSDPIELFKIAEQLFKKAPTPFSEAEKVFSVWFVMPDKMQDRLVISPMGEPWADYNSFKHFAINVAAAEKIQPATRNAQSARAMPSASRATASRAFSNAIIQLPPAPNPGRSYKSGVFSSSASRPPFSVSQPPQKRAYHGPRTSSANRFQPVSHKSENFRARCKRCGSNDHHIGDSVNRDGKTPVCPKFVKGVDFLRITPGRK